MDVIVIVHTYKYKHISVLSNLSSAHISKRAHTQECIHFSIESNDFSRVETPTILGDFIYYNIHTEDIVVDITDCMQDTISCIFNEDIIIRD
jgi:hypothetical protein